MNDTVSWFEGRTDQMVDQILRLVESESPSEDPAALSACADVLGALSHEVVGRSPEIVEVGDRRHLRWRLGGDTQVLVLGHYDTVWPVGTLEQTPAECRDGRISGPGCFDMKAGIVLGLHAVAGLDRTDGVTVLFSADEESGSATSKALIESEASGAQAVLVLEPSAPGGAVKRGRKGVASYRVRLSGRSAHAGLEPHKGINAVVEAAHEVLATTAIGDPEVGTTVTPTIAAGGSMVNVVPDAASVEIDVRAETVDEMERVNRAITSRMTVTDCERDVEQMSWRPPLEAAMSAGLYTRLGAVADRLGLASPDGVVVGGGSDGNFTAAIGVPTLDGLGAVGDGAHAAHEHVLVDDLAPRAALVSGLIAAVQATCT